MISVAITTYNGENFIIEQLTSILNQTLKADEVIICDDGSTDNTIKLIEEFICENNLDGKWKIVKNENSLGFIKNFLKAISLTSGDYIFLSDQDDIFLPDKFKIMSEFFEHNPECKVLNANYSFIDENSSHIYSTRITIPKRKTKKLSFKEFLFHSNYPGFSMGFKKEMINQLKEINSDCIYGHDILINLLGLEHNGVYQINQVLSLYRVHNTNTSGLGSTVSNYDIKSRILQKENELVEYEKLIQFINSNSILENNIEFIDLRRKQLRKRIACLKKKSFLPLLTLCLFERAYPIKTIIGDILFIIKSKKEEI